MKELEFYKCEECDYLKVELVEESSCDGNSMFMLIPNTEDAATEKHLPVATFEGEILKVEVGSVLHPMTEEHYISGIYIVTDNSMYIQKELSANDTPSYMFKIDNAKKVDVYAVCNLHGVWKTTVER